MGEVVEDASRLSRELMKLDLSLSFVAVCTSPLVQSAR
jgi:hypothetical protein